VACVRSLQSQLKEAKTELQNIYDAQLAHELQERERMMYIAVVRGAMQAAQAVQAAHAEDEEEEE
jgi:hypothetical protein